MRSLSAFPYGAALLALALVLGPACAPQQPHGAAPPVPVRVGKAIQKTVPVQVQAVGNVEAYSTVSVQGQISGELTKVFFKEGQEVKKGDPLFEIDPRPFLAAVTQAQADLLRDQARADSARADARRYADLAPSGYVPRQQSEGAQFNAAAADATLAADEAAVKTAQLNLGYTLIRAPIPGRTGSVLVQPGNVVSTGNNAKSLVVINQIQPIYATFSVPQKHLPSLRADGVRPLAVSAAAPGEKEPHQGVLTFVDNAINVATGTVRLKATFPNEDEALWPGEFVQVTLTLGELPGAVVVPAQAIERGQAGSYAFVVKPDMTVESRSVEVERADEREAVIARGLKPGETVVTDGQLRLVSGAKVAIAKAEITGEVSGS